MTLTAIGRSHIGMHDLHMRVEERDGQPEWVIGRPETGQFIAVPQIAVEIIRLLNAGLTVAETRERISRDQGRDVDVAGFTTNLIDLGFVRRVDADIVPGTEPARPSLPWLRPEHLRWLTTRPMAAATAIIVTAAVTTVVSQPGLLPAYHDLLWSRHTTAVLLGNALLAWLIIVLHELAHLTTARAAGVGGRMSLGTRLQFLVAQTDVSGIWASPRSRRMAVYTSGMMVNVLIAAAAVCVRAVTGADSTAGRLAAAVVVLSLLFLPPQLLLFMRTDLYFVMQDLTGCRNLYTDGTAYLTFLGRTTWRKITRSAARPVNPLPALPARERRTIRWYAVVLAVGTAACLTVAAAVTVPFAVSIIARTIAGLTDAAGPGQTADAALTIMTVILYWSLWGAAWWRRHGIRVTGLLRRHAPTPPRTPETGGGGDRPWSRS